MKINLKIEVINTSNNPLPVYANIGDAGMDVRADFTHPNKFKFFGHSDFISPTTLKINPGDRILIPTGLKISIPEDMEIQVRPRSGLALKHGITVLNSPGTIDHGYKDEIGIILINHGTESFEITHGDKIAQIVLNKIETIEFKQVTEFTNKQNRNGGYGSTGV